MEPTFLNIQKISNILYKIIFDQTTYLNVQTEALKVIKMLIEDPYS